MRALGKHSFVLNQSLNNSKLHTGNSLLPRKTHVANIFCSTAIQLPFAILKNKNHRLKFTKFIKFETDRTKRKFVSSYHQCDESYVKLV